MWWGEELGAPSVLLAVEISPLLARGCSKMFSLLKH